MLFSPNIRLGFIKIHLFSFLVEIKSHKDVGVIIATAVFGLLAFGVYAANLYIRYRKWKIQLQCESKIDKLEQGKRKKGSKKKNKQPKHSKPKAERQTSKQPRYSIRNLIRNTPKTNKDKKHKKKKNKK